MAKISDEKLAELNARDFKREGCRWPQLSNERLAKELGIARVWSGGGTGSLIGYERIKTKKD